MRFEIKAALVISAIGLVLFAGWEYLSRPHHKYRLTVEVETPDGVKSASNVMEVYKDRLSLGGIGGGASLKGDAVFVDLCQGQNLIALLNHGIEGSNPNEMTQLAMDAFAAAGKKVLFDETAKLSGVAEIEGNLIPTLLSFADLKNPQTARIVDPKDLNASFGNGYRLRRLFLEMLPMGLWPFDFGEPVTRGIERRFPWWNEQMPWTKLLNGATYIDTRKTGFRWRKDHLTREL